MIAEDLANGILPTEIIAFTFTNKAAEELLSRVHYLIGKNIGQQDLAGLYVGTIHAWCLQYLLKQQDFFNFEAIDELHQDSLVSRFYDHLKLEQVYGKPFPMSIEDFAERPRSFLQRKPENQRCP